MFKKTIILLFSAILFLATASLVTSAQYVAPGYGQPAGSFGSNGPLGVNEPTSATAPYAAGVPANAAASGAVNQPYAATGAPINPGSCIPNAPYTASLPCAAPLAAAPYAAPLGAPLAAPCGVPFAGAPLAAPVAPFSGGFTFSTQSASAFGPCTPPVSQTSEQFYQFPGLTPCGPYPGAGYAATGGVGFDPVTGYYGPFGAAMPL